MYYVSWANSLWNIDGHHSLVRWKLVIHGCCDGFYRKIMFLKCSTNNMAATVLQCFEEAINQNGVLWLSRVRVDHGVASQAKREVKDGVALLVVHRREISVLNACG